MLVTTYLPGVLVEGHAAEWAEDTYRPAGALLALLHGQGARPAPEHEGEADARALAWLDQPHRIDTATEERLRGILTSGERPVGNLARLAAQQFRGRPELERAFLEGYGTDPRTPESWRLIRVREALAG